jgi:hypothetical protein
MDNDMVRLRATAYATIELELAREFGQVLVVVVVEGLIGGPG